ncbi:hypothetical protein FRAAL2952 [Frankia alni ACN14a]|uniref:Uncharacterized protein n=1 Tax=Frankia alni (strain DSM 45986 / CECT 9034 / ACN14a) TaxID=326424 RepID=Q0RLK8_FRAAA|nr:hypothetical protein FRAAL2952 [Frankia alni ACN14a]
MDGLRHHNCRLRSRSYLSFRRDRWDLALRDAYQLEPRCGGRRSVRAPRPGRLASHAVMVLVRQRGRSGTDASSGSGRRPWAR